MTPLIRTQLIEDNTRNFAFSKQSTICSKRRPCYREKKCKYCRKRKIWFIRNQIITCIFQWDLNTFCTASIVGFAGHPQEGLQALSAIRSFFHKKVFRSSKYISFIAIGEKGKDCFSSGYTPHFHVLFCGRLTKEQFRSYLVSAVPDFKWNVHFRPIERTKLSAFRLGSYLMLENYFPTLKFRSPRIRLITASQGMFTGRPRQLGR